MNVVKAYQPCFREEVAALLAETRRQRRQDFPFLPPGLSDAATAERALARLESQGGAVALDGQGRAIGFMFAEPTNNPPFGPAVITGVDAWAAIRGASGEVLPELYAAVFHEKMALLSTGPIPEHRVLCSSGDRENLEAWFKLGFGVEQVYAAALLENMETSSTAPKALLIQRAQAGDEAELEALSPLIATFQTQAPTWAAAPAPYLEEIRRGYRDLATDPEALVWLARLEGRVVGFQAWFPVPAHSVDGVSDGAVELSVASTLPETRGMGIGRALTAHGVKEARSAGYSICFTDWRSANPKSSRFWPARGFRPLMYRLVRRIDPLAWPLLSGQP